MYLIDTAKSKQSGKDATNFGKCQGDTDYSDQLETGESVNLIQEEAHSHSVGAAGVRGMSGIPHRPPCRLTFCSVSLMDLNVHTFILLLVLHWPWN